MNRRWLILLVLLFPALHAEAAVMSRDWKTPGDGLLTFDTVNKREWLDLSQTILNSQFPGATLDQRYQFVVGELNSGGLFSNFTVATADEVRALAVSAGIDISDRPSAANVAPVMALGELISFTINPSGGGNGNKLSVGLLDDVSEPPLSARVGAIFSVEYAATPDRAGLRITSNSDFLEPPRTPAVYLLRAIPEPSSLVTSLLAWTLGNLVRRRRRTSAAKQWNHGRSVGFERLEDRRVLASMADIVFLLDESDSVIEGTNNQWDWLRDRVFASEVGLSNPISDALSAKGFSDTDVRYGLIGYGGSRSIGSDFAHSYIAENGNMTGATRADGDLDGDGEVTMDDLDLALAQYGLGIVAVS
jgi:hypothetical protein